jgi:chromosome segregation ATPase
MNVLDEITALESEIADTNARIDKVNAEVEAIKRKTIEIRNRVSKIEEDAQKQISDPNFPEAEKQRILAKMRALKSM